MRVFRVEHRHTMIGPFRPTEELRKALGYHHWRGCYIGLSDGHLSPWMDIKGHWDSTYFFGVECEMDVNYWFRPILLLLKKHGYVLNIYEVCRDYVEVGACNQCAFKRDRATLLETRELI